MQNMQLSMINLNSQRGGDEMAVRDGRGDVKQTTTGFRDPRHHICQKQIPIPKSTTLDLLMGLLIPTEGYLLVDDQHISGNRMRAWQRSIAHVPQSIYLSDTTMAENIAFGVPLENIDFERVKLAARQAQIAEFIESNRHGYQAKVGERGVRLSGGQRQRIGIARALYKQASVLIFDEATSALDNATEQYVMDAIDGLSRELTILIIAHRLTTVQRCDMIVQLEQGQIVAKGLYDQLNEQSPSFKKMVKVL